MIETTDLLEILHEIEFITDINGCFFISVEDNSLIESTIPFNIRKEILWEICVLRDTFQQFANEIKHGTLSELMLEGDKGYIFLFSIPPHLVLLAMASYETNISYLKLAMIDILKRIRERIKELGDDVLKIPAKEFGVLGEKIAVSKKVVTPILSKPTPVVVEPPKPTPVVVEPPKPTPVVVESSKPTPVAVESSKPTPVASIAKHLKEELDLEAMISSIKTKELIEKYRTIKKIFDRLKQEIKMLTGVECSKILNLLKESILENIGTSLALFDLSRNSADLSKIHDKLPLEEIKKYQNKIDNWSNRIVKL